FPYTTLFRSLLLVEPERLGMDVQHLGDHPDHVQRLASVGHVAPPRYRSSAVRGASGISRWSSRTSSWVRASSPIGISMRTATNRSPIASPHNLANPWPRRRKT